MEVAAPPRSGRRPVLRRVFTPTVALAAGAVLVLVVIALEFVSSRDYIFLPDKAHPVAPLVKVAGGHDPTGAGGIYFVDVIVRKASLLEQIFGGLHSGADLVPPTQVVPPGISSAQNDQVNATEMRTSQQVAAAVALRAVGKKVTTSEDGALVSRRRARVPGRARPPPDRRDHRRRRQARPHAGRRLAADERLADRVDVPLHDPAKRQARWRCRSRPSPPATARSGASSACCSRPTESIKLPLHVSIDAHGVGGPSAGLAFALDVLQELGRNVDRGHKIAATGEIFLDGSVGPIGGIKQKTIGAREAGVDAFLVPAGQNAVDARKYAHGLRIIPVKNFQQALHALATLPEQR